MSPMTVMTVVLVVGVRPRGHTSGAAPVSSTASARCASGLSGAPVMTIFGRPS